MLFKSKFWYLTESSTLDTFCGKPQLINGNNVLSKMNHIQSNRKQCSKHFEDMYWSESFNPIWLHLISSTIPFKKNLTYMLKWIKNNSIKYWGIVDQMLVMWVNRNSSYRTILETWRWKIHKTSYIYDLNKLYEKFIRLSYLIISTVCNLNIVNLDERLKFHQKIKRR